MKEEINYTFDSKKVKVYIDNEPWEIEVGGMVDKYTILRRKGIFERNEADKYHVFLESRIPGKDDILFENTNLPLDCNSIENNDRFYTSPKKINNS